MSYLDKDFINMFSYPAADNIEQCRESFQNVIDAYSIEGVKYNRTECLVDLNYAIETGMFEQSWISNDHQDTIDFKMRGMSIWKKQPDGSWKMYRLIAQQ
jgi:ketosteroid isomerase-like protein